MRDLKEGVVVKLKKNSKASCDKSLEIFCTLLFYPFSEVICTTKALLQGK